MTRNLAARVQQQPATDVATQEQAPAPAGGGLTVFQQIQQQLETRRAFFTDAMARHMDVDLFMARIMNEIRKNPTLAQCTFTSLMGAAVTSAQLGLEVGPLGHFYLTPRRNKEVWEVVPVIGYKGYIALARRHGGMSIDADDRRENDRWVYRRGTDPVLETAPPDRGGRGDVLGYWAAAAFTGGSAAHYMSLEDLEAHALKYASDSRGKPKGFARINWDAWCRKTVIRQMTWKLPQSTEIVSAMEADESAAYWRDDSRDVVRIGPAEDAGDAGDATDEVPAADVPPQSGGEYDPTDEPGWPPENPA